MCLNLFASHEKEKKYCFLIIFQSIKFDYGVFNPIKGNLMEGSSYVRLNGWQRYWNTFDECSESDYVSQVQEYTCKHIL